MHPSRDIEVVIIGAGGHGRELYSYVRDIAATGARVRLLGLIDDNQPRGPWLESEILGSIQDIKALQSAASRPELSYITAVGDNETRARLVHQVEALGISGLQPWTLRHPAAVVGRDVEIGPGTCLAPGSVLTTQVRIGSHCIINVNASVSHDSVVGDFSNINPGVVIAGSVTIGRGCFIGAGATVIQKISIGDGAVIGAGAVVVRDIPARVTAVGVPARVSRRHEAEG